jgi:hypothetical protein
MKLTTHLRFTFEVTNVWSYAHNSSACLRDIHKAALFWAFVHEFRSVEFYTHGITVTVSLHLILISFLLACKYANFLSLLCTVNTSALYIHHHHTLFIVRVIGLWSIRGYCQTFIHFTFIFIFSFVYYIFKTICLIVD